MSRRSARVRPAALLVAILAALLPATAGAAAVSPSPIPGPRLTGTVWRTLDDPRLTESSGLAVSTRFPGVIYTHNDSDAGPVLFAVDADGRTVELQLTGAPARDWEALAAVPDGDGATLWVADIGDNLASWPSVRLLRTAEPAELRDQSLPWVQYDLVYPDGPHNAEALLADPRSGALFIVTKEASNPGVFAVPALPDRGGATASLRRIAGAPAGVTDGAIGPDGTIALVDYVYLWTAPGWDGPWTRRALPFRPQGESVAWLDSDTLLVGSEGTGSQLLAVDLTPASESPSTGGSAAATGGPAAVAPSPGAADGPGTGLPAGTVWGVGVAVAVAVGFGAAWRSRSVRGGSN